MENALTSMFTVTHSYLVPLGQGFAFDLETIHSIYMASP
jgi:hypothetical protein